MQEKKRELLKIEGLKVEYRTDEATFYAVDGISFELGVGETLGLVGETGAGKTTTALSIMKLLPKRIGVASGKILFKGEDLSKAVVGSSAIKSSGSQANAIAITTRCFIPPENSFGYSFFLAGWIPTMRSISSTRSDTSFTPCVFKTSAICSPTVIISYFCIKNVAIRLILQTATLLPLPYLH